MNCITYIGKLNIYWIYNRYGVLCLNYSYPPAIYLVLFVNKKLLIRFYFTQILI